MWSGWSQNLCHHWVTIISGTSLETANWFLYGPMGPWNVWGGLASRKPGCWIHIWSSNIRTILHHVNCHIFPYIGNHNPDWLIFVRGVGIPPTRCKLPHVVQSLEQRGLPLKPQAALPVVNCRIPPLQLGDDWKLVAETATCLILCFFFRRRNTSGLWRRCWCWARIFCNRDAFHEQISSVIFLLMWIATRKHLEVSMVAKGAKKLPSGFHVTWNLGLPSVQS